jgi:hypothetical protein
MFKPTLTQVLCAVVFLIISGGVLIDLEFVGTGIAAFLCGLVTLFAYDV